MYTLRILTTFATHHHINKTLWHSLVALIPSYIRYPLVFHYVSLHKTYHDHKNKINVAANTGIPTIHIQWEPNKLVNIICQTTYFLEEYNHCMQNCSKNLREIPFQFEPLFLMICDESFNVWNLLLCLRWLIFGGEWDKHFVEQVEWPEVLHCRQDITVFFYISKVHDDHNDHTKNRCCNVTITLYHI